MDFIERWFGISPDGGNGGFEIAFVLVLAACCAVGFLGRHLVWPARSRASCAKPKT
ncbi:MAG TPA: hypothetical protein VKA15_01030 [Isosphaeraceae bacterium]|nr:hypothetical protein [Isosphaeraceae bacterium]